MDGPVAQHAEPHGDALPGHRFTGNAMSVGRGTDTPFEVIGAPYIDDVRLAERLNALAKRGDLRAGAFHAGLQRAQGRVVWRGEHHHHRSGGVEAGRAWHRHRPCAARDVPAEIPPDQGRPPFAIHRPLRHLAKAQPSPRSRPLGSRAWQISKTLHRFCSTNERCSVAEDERVELGLRELEL